VLPGHEFRLVGGLLTNFHLPGSSLIVLVSAFAGRERVLRAYRHAVQAGFRFYSYGDACLFLAGSGEAPAPGKVPPGVEPATPGAAPARVAGVP
jgi:S-adenosylmethionine:tRNA ribosyltransferase-isomerase